MWITSTGTTLDKIGLIVIILPFAFAYLMEMQKEIAKIMQSKIISLCSGRQQ